MSIWKFITNSKKNRFRNKLDFLSSLNLIFAGYTGSKNQVRTRKKIKFDSKSIFWRVWNKLPNWHFKNQAQIDTVCASWGLFFLWNRLSLVWLTWIISFYRKIDFATFYLWCFSTFIVRISSEANDWKILQAFQLEFWL